MEAKTNMTRLQGAAPHHEREPTERRADSERAVEHPRAATQSLANPQDRAAFLLALRAVAEAYGGLATVAAEADISRESLYRTLFAKGEPNAKNPGRRSKNPRPPSFRRAGAPGSSVTVGYSGPDG